MCTTRTKTGAMFQYSSAMSPESRICRTFFKAIKKDGRSLHGVVNCAGIAIAPGRNPKVKKATLEQDFEKEILPILRVNLHGPVIVSQVMLPLLLETPNSCIVNVASVAGRIGLPGNGAYSMSKFGLNGLTSSLRKELRSKGVRVYSVEPGMVNTPLASPFAAQDIDLSQTQFSELFQNISNNAKNNTPDKWMHPNQVGRQIFQCLFCSRLRTPHILVAKPPMKVVFAVFTSLPHAWADWLVERLKM